MNLQYIGTTAYPSMQCDSTNGRWKGRTTLLFCMYFSFYLSCFFFFFLALSRSPGYEIDLKQVFSTLGTQDGITHFRVSCKYIWISLRKKVLLVLCIK